MNIKSIISGGNTGADQAGLFAAEQLGLTTGGYAPKDFKTEGGNAKWLEDRFGILESTSSNYTVRTMANVEMADATLIFGRRSVGSNKTEEYCRLADKPCLWVWWPACSVCHLVQYVQVGGGLSCAYGHADAPTEIPNPLRVKLWLARVKPVILNIAGNRESKNPGIGEFTKDFLVMVLQ